VTIGTILLGMPGWLPRVDGQDLTGETQRGHRGAATMTSVAGAGCGVLVETLQGFFAILSTPFVGPCRFSHQVEPERSVGAIRKSPLPARYLLATSSAFISIVSNAIFCARRTSPMTKLPLGVKHHFAMA
jgi:hypothetical protein